jgi:hypothetical protein
LSVGPGGLVTISQELSELETIPALSIGSIEGGWSPVNKTWREKIRNLIWTIDEAQQGVESPVNVNVIFHIPGDILVPDYRGARTGHFSKKENSLKYESTSSGSSALEQAEIWARKRGIAEDLTELRRIAEAT